MLYECCCPTRREMVLFRSSAGFCGFDSVDGYGVFNWTGADYTSRWRTKTMQGSWVTDNTIDSFDALAVWDGVDSYAAQTGVASFEGSYVYTTDGQSYGGSTGATRPVNFELETGQNATFAEVFANTHIFWHTPYAYRNNLSEWPGPGPYGPIHAGTQPNDSGSITPTVYSYTFPAVTYEWGGGTDTTWETVYAELSNPVIHGDNLADAESIMDGMSWSSNASPWAKVWPSWGVEVPRYQNWQVWVRDAFLAGELGNATNNTPIDFSLQPCLTLYGYPFDAFDPLRAWLANLGVHGWSGWVWDGSKFTLSKTQLRGVPGTWYSLVKLTVNRTGGTRTIDAVVDAGGDLFDTTPLELAMPTETPFPAANTGGKIVEVWVCAIMGMSAADWAAAHGLTLEFVTPP